jgi:hypothetical protein
MDKKVISKVAFWLSVVTLVMAAVVSVFQLKLWLAGTQWILISVVLGIYAIYLDSCCCDVKKDVQ